MTSTISLRATVASALALTFSAVCVPAQTGWNRTAPLGVNMAEVSYFSSELAFVDAMKQSSEWIPQKVNGGPWNTGQRISQDAKGWVTSLLTDQAVATLMLRGLKGNYPGGSYVVLYDGDGDVEIGFDGFVTRRQAGRIEMTVGPTDSGILLRITRTNPSNYVRNIRVMQTKFEPTYKTQPLHPELLDDWKAFSTVRFMEWGRINHTNIGQWSERVLPDERTQGGEDGVAYEYMFDFANAIEAHPWVCVPYLANDAFVTQLATMAKNRLKPGLKLHVEYANEVWNPLYPAYTYAEVNGRALRLSTNNYEAALRYYSQRSVEIFRIVRNIMGANRTVRLLCGQHVSPYVLTTELTWKNAAQDVDAIAIAPYIGTDFGDPQNAARTLSWSDNELLFRTYLDISRAMGPVRTHKQLADTHNVDLYTYEGGQSLVGFNGAENLVPLTNKFIRVNRRFEWFYLYPLFLDAWKREGGKLFMQFNSTTNYSKWGSWGALESSVQDPLTAYKYLGLLYFQVLNPRWF